MMARLRLGAGLLGLLLLVAPRAAAQGLVVGPDALDRAERAALEGGVARAREESRTAFADVAAVVGLAARHRGPAPDPRATLASALRRLGPVALWPMLELVVLRAPARGAASDAAWNALPLALLEAIGALRDPRASAALRAVFERPPSEPLRRAAARGLGRLCDAQAERLLVGASGRAADAAPPGARRPEATDARIAAIAGLGHCRSLQSATVLADRLADAVRAAGAYQGGGTEPEVAVAAAEALGIVGSSWAWRALGPSREREALRVRAIAARALLDALLWGDESTAHAASRSVAMVEHPATRRWAEAVVPHLPAARRAKLERVLARIDVQ